MIGGGGGGGRGGGPPMQYGITCPLVAAHTEACPGASSFGTGMYHHPFLAH